MLHMLLQAFSVGTQWCLLLHFNRQEVHTCYGEETLSIAYYITEREEFHDPL